MAEHTMMRSPVLLAVVATVSWGFWAFFTKLATRSGQPESVLVISYALGSAVGLVYFALTPGSFEMTNRDFGFAVAAGLATGIGSMLYYSGLKYGTVGQVTTITGLYFFVSVTLSVLLLGEALTVRKIAGIGLAVAAIVLLSN